MEALGSRPRLKEKQSKEWAVEWLVGETLGGQHCRLARGEDVDVNGWRRVQDGKYAVVLI
jgi:hypothetical protein